MLTDVHPFISDPSGLGPMEEGADLYELRGSQIKTDTAYIHLSVLQ